MPKNTNRQSDGTPTRSRARLPYGLVGIAVGLFAWEIGVRVGHVPDYIAPSFSEAVMSAVRNRASMLSDTWVTLQEVVSGFLLSVTVGLAFAVAIVAIRPLGKAIFPLLVISQMVPKLAFAPVFLVWFGFGMTSKILISFLLSFFPITINAVLGLRSARVETLYLARTSGAGWWKTYRYILFPGALPYILSGIKIGATFSVIGAVVGEYIGADHGIGRQILAAGAASQTDAVFAAVLYISGIGLSAFLLMEFLERLIVPWHVSQRRERAGIGGTT